MRGTDGLALSTGQILDLMDRIHESGVAPKWHALRVALEWVADLAAGGAVPAVHHETEPAAQDGCDIDVSDFGVSITVIGGAVAAFHHPDTGAAVPGDTGPGTPAVPSSAAPEGMLPPDDRRGPQDGACGPDENETPAGPQGGAEGRIGKAQAAPAPVAPKAPKAEGSRPPPAPPVAGGGAPSRNGLPWTEEEEARAVTLRLGGLTVPEIAAALGRTKAATVMQFSKRISAMVAKAREAIITGDDAAAPEPEPEPESATPERAEPEPLAEPAPAPRAAPAPAPQPAAAPVEWRASMTERQIAAHLDALPPDAFWDAARDFRLAHALWTGEAASGAAELLGCTRAEAIARWRLLCPVVSLDNQRHLNALLKARLPLAAGAPIMEAAA